MSGAARYLSRAPTRADVKSIWVGLRPLVKPQGEDAENTKSLSREHTVLVGRSGLLTVTGGKWTTYRHMAEDCVDHCITLGRLRDEPCTTKNLHIHGYVDALDEPLHEDEPLAVYGADADAIRTLARDAALAAPLHPDLPYIGAEIVWGARAEMARSVEDALARRTRALFLNAGAAMAMAESTARLLARELGRDEAWVAAQVSEFRALAQEYKVM